jgi:hypothetical protein
MELTFMTYTMMGDMPENGYKMAVIGPENGGGLYDPFGNKICDNGSCALGLPYLEMSNLAYQTFAESLYYQIYFTPPPSQPYLAAYTLLSRVNTGDNKITIALNMNAPATVTLNDIECNNEESLDCENVPQTSTEKAIGTFDITMQNLPYLMQNFSNLFYNSEFVTYTISY